MLMQIIYTCEVPDEDISEMNDATIGALNQLRTELLNTTNPCGGNMNLTFVYDGKTY